MIFPTVPVSLRSSSDVCRKPRGQLKHARMWKRCGRMASLARDLGARLWHNNHRQETGPITIATAIRAETACSDESRYAVDTEEEHG